MDASLPSGPFGFLFRQLLLYVCVIPSSNSAPPVPEKEKSREKERHVAAQDATSTRVKDSGSKRTKSSKTRETETYKLVRSASGHTIPTEVIMGMGEQWEVVGSKEESPKKSRRKSSTRTAVPSAGVPKTLSIADVVKTQPKPAQNEWGGFKVVNKKKKGGRN